MKKLYKKGELSGLILDYFLAQLELPVTMLFYPRSEVYRLFHASDYYNRQRINHAISVLGMKNLIKVEGLGADARIKIFPSKLRQTNKFKLRQMVLPKSSSWDGKWRMVIFDVPETNKRTRDSMAKKLKELGFRAIQKSTFIYPFDCEKEIQLIKAYFSLTDELNYIIAKKIDNDKEIRKMFSL